MEVKHSCKTYIHRERERGVGVIFSSHTRAHTGITFFHTCTSLPLSLSLTYDADDEGEQVNDAVKQLYVPLCLMSKYSVDQDSWREREREVNLFSILIHFFFSKRTLSTQPYMRVTGCNNQSNRATKSKQTQ